MSNTKQQDQFKHVVGKQGEHVYLFNVPVAYAAVFKPTAKYQAPNDFEFKATAFLTAEQRAFLEDEVLVNKTIAEVDKDRNKKRAIKYSSENFPYAEGLHGISLTKPAKSKKGDPNSVTVIEIVDGKSVPFEQDIGNGSVCTIKLWGYRNQDNLLNVQLDTIVVGEHVPYQRGSGGVIEDDILGVTYETKRPTKQPESDELEGDVPFETEEDDDDDIPY